MPAISSAAPQVTVSNDTLTETVQVANAGTSKSPLKFTTALHTYFRVADISATHVEGLSGLRYLDNMHNRQEGTDEQDVISVSGEIDRIYVKAPDQLKVSLYCMGFGWNAYCCCTGCQSDKFAHETARLRLVTPRFEICCLSHVVLGGFTSPTQVLGSSPSMVTDCKTCPAAGGQQHAKVIECHTIAIGCCVWTAACSYLHEMEFGCMWTD